MSFPYNCHRIFCCALYLQTTNVIKQNKLVQLAVCSLRRETNKSIKYSQRKPFRNQFEMEMFTIKRNPCAPIFYEKIYCGYFRLSLIDINTVSLPGFYLKVLIEVICKLVAALTDGNGLFVRARIIK